MDDRARHEAAALLAVEPLGVAEPFAAQAKRAAACIASAGPPLTRPATAGSAAFRRSGRHAPVVFTSASKGAECAWGSEALVTWTAASAQALFIQVGVPQHS